jgi:hypothetical protein
MNILFIGDIVGRIGRQAVGRILPKLRKKHNLDLVVANAENSAHGSGITDTILKELQGYGVDFFTAGDHAFMNRKNLDIYDRLPIIRPANWSPEAPGRGYAEINVKGKKILMISLIGRVFMRGQHDCPFHKLNEILANISLPVDSFYAIMVDIHAETTSEKINMMHFADGRITALLGTHTHIQTADAQVSDQGTAYITDVGMTGAADESLGIGKEGTLKTFLTQIKAPHVIPEKGRAQLCGALVRIGKNQKATGLKPVIEYVNIN